MVEILWLVDILLYKHKQLTDNCDLIELARQFCAEANSFTPATNQANLSDPCPFQDGEWALHPLIVRNYQGKKRHWSWK